MKYKIFDVIELNNGNNATILDVNKSTYKVEIVDSKGIKQAIKEINELEIKKQIFSKQ